MVNSEFQWQLKDHYRSRQKYNVDLFVNLMEIVEELAAVGKDLLRVSFGPDAGKAQKILDAQQSRFTRR